MTTPSTRGYRRSCHAAERLPKMIMLPSLNHLDAEIEAAVPMRCPSRAEFQARHEAEWRAAR